LRLPPLCFLSSKGNNVISAEFGAQLSALLKEINMHFVKAFIPAITIGLIGPIAMAQTAMTSPQEFVKAAASPDMFEIRSSELALRKSQTSRVKEFARMMIKDHKTSSKQLLSAARKDDLAVEPEITSKHAAQSDALSNDSGEAFDSAYVEAQVAAHQEALALMTSYAKNGEAKHLAAHAKKTASPSSASISNMPSN
jgi:putative membrane protein